MRRHLILLVCLSLLPLLGFAQEVYFDGGADARQVILSGYVNVTFTLHNANGSEFQAPPFKDFEILSGPNTSTSMRIENGVRSQSYGLSYQLQPRKIGKFTIGAASIKANGKAYRSSPFQIEVVKGRESTASTREELNAELKEQLFLKAEPSTTQARIGEQIVVDYKIYTTRDIETYNLLDESNYSGFFAQDLRRYNGREVREVIDGVQYSTKVLKRIALYPQQAGMLTIDPMILQLYVVTDKSGRRRSLFSMPKMTPVRVQTEALEIEVQPLPSGAPVSFSGAVGRYNMRSTLNRTELTTDDATSLRMFITGNGDIKQIQAPQLELPPEFEVYDPKVIEENSFENGGELAGKKTFEYLLLPKKPGNYKLAFGFTYFDTDSMAYITLRSDTMNLAVTQGTLGSRVATQSREAISQEDILPIKTTATFSQPAQTFFSTPTYWICFGLPFIFLGGILVVRRIQEKHNNVDVSLLKSRRAQKVAQKKLALSKDYLGKGQSKAFYDEISRASFGYICDKLNIPLSELTKDNVRTQLKSLDVSESSIERFLKVIQTCEMALFAGKDNTAAMQETYQAAIENIAMIEEEIVG